MDNQEMFVITVVAVDIRNFTHHSLRRDHETDTEFAARFARLCDLARDFHDLTVSCVREADVEGRTVVTSTGDGLLLAFHDDRHALTAMRTVHKLRELYPLFFLGANHLFGEKRFSTALGYGIGIHTGHVLERRWHAYEAPSAYNRLFLGDAINIAARLEKLTRDHPGCDTMISEDSYAAILGQAGEEAGAAALAGCIDYQHHFIRGYRPLHLYGLHHPNWRAMAHCEPVCATLAATD